MTRKSSKIPRTRCITKSLCIIYIYIYIYIVSNRANTVVMTSIGTHEVFEWNSWESWWIRYPYERIVFFINYQITFIIRICTEGRARQAFAWVENRAYITVMEHFSSERRHTEGEQPIWGPPPFWDGPNWRADINVKQFPWHAIKWNGQKTVEYRLA